ncbi:ClpP/crotonase-like domain-containing protein [Dichotomocladium elegans]|nr:ClpP/crotonase-like domain-containing protein [Dichotomocladium elegans]
MSSPSKYQYGTLQVSLHPDGVAHVELNRPKKLNAFNDALVRDIRVCFQEISADTSIRVVIVSGSGRMFTAGLDLADHMLLDLPSGKNSGKDSARLAYANRAHIKDFQDAFTAIEECTQPVIAAVHNGCFGAGVDMITACDIRYGTKDSFYCVKEVDIGLASDVGSLQRLPKVIGNQSLVRELCLTGRFLQGPEAYRCGLLSKLVDTKEQVLEEAFKTARLIASKSPVAVVGTKHLLNYSRDRTIADGLAYTLTWSSAMLNTEDIPLSVQAFVEKKPATYSKL